MPLIAGRDRVHYDRVIVEAELNVDDFEIVRLQTNGTDLRLD